MLLFFSLHCSLIHALWTCRIFQLQLMSCFCILRSPLSVFTVSIHPYMMTNSLGCPCFLWDQDVCDLPLWLQDSSFDSFIHQSYKYFVLYLQFCIFQPRTPYSLRESLSKIFSSNMLLLTYLFLGLENMWHILFQHLL